MMMEINKNLYDIYNNIYYIYEAMYIGICTYILCNTYMPYFNKDAFFKNIRNYNFQAKSRNPVYVKGIKSRCN